jgi:hypothetical protein
MPTRKYKRRNAAQERLERVASRTPSEMMLRRQLTHSGKIKNEDDDAGLVAWLKGLNTPTEDSRSEWEKRLQARLEEDLAVA